MKNNDKIQAKKTYFSCLDIYESSIVFTSKEASNYSDFAHKVNTIILHRYKVIKVLAQNEFGFVYLVERTNKNKKFIIKEFFPHEYVTRNAEGRMIINVPLDVDKLIRFNRMQKFFMGEVNNLEKISIQKHENIIQITSIEKNKNNTTYIIFPYEEGMTLQEYMDNNAKKGERRFDNQKIYQILEPLLNAVEHLHALDIFHLNINPENIFIQKNGSLLLMGFESSIFFHDKDSRLYCNAYTPKYAAPEQINIAEFSTIGKTSDIYAIGVLLYKMVTGKYPIEAKKRIDYQEKHTKNDPYILLREKKEFLTKYTPELLFTIDKAMMIAPKDRFRDIATLKYTLYKKTIKSSRSFLFYPLLLIILIFIIIGGWNSIGNDNELTINNTKDLLLMEENSKKLEQEKIEQEKIEQKKIEQKKLEQKKLEQEKLEQKKIEQEKIEQEKIEQEKIEQKKLEQKKLEQEKLEQEKLEQKKLEQEKLEQKKLEQEKLEQEKLIWNNDKINHIKSKYQEQKIPRPKNLNEIKREIKNITDDKITLINIERNTKPKIKQNTRKTLNKTKDLLEALIHKKEKVLRKKKREERVLHKKKTKKKVLRKKSSVTNNSGLVWYCKAQSGIIRTSAKHSNWKESQKKAIRQCNRKSGKQKKCRIVNCFLKR